MELEIKLTALAGESLPTQRVLEVIQDRYELLDEPQELDLAARYHDDDGQLRAAGWTLRSRRENRLVMATLKGPGPRIEGLPSQTEIEVEVPSVPEPGAPLPDELAQALAATEAPLTSWPPRLFGTVIQRTRAQVQLEDECVVELAIDRGAVLAGADTSPVCELELEWKSGPAAPMVPAALHLARWFKVRPGGRSKAARGAALQGRIRPPSHPGEGADDDALWGWLCAIEELLREGNHEPLDDYREARSALGLPPFEEPLELELESPEHLARLWALWSRVHRP